MSGHIEDVLTRRVHRWWPPIRKALEAGLARHSENSLLAAKTTIPAEVKRQLKALKDAGKIPDMKRVENDSPSRFYPAYRAAPGAWRKAGRDLGRADADQRVVS